MKSHSGAPTASGKWRHEKLHLVTKSHSYVTDCHKKLLQSSRLPVLVTALLENHDPFNNNFLKFNRITLVHEQGLHSFSNRIDTFITMLFPSSASNLLKYYPTYFSRNTCIASEFQGITSHHVDGENIILDKEINFLPTANSL